VHQKNNYTLRPVAIATFLVPVSICEKNKTKQKSPFATSEVTQKVLFGTNIVPILSSLPSLDWVGLMVLGLRQKLRTSVFV